MFFPRFRALHIFSSGSKNPHSTHLWSLGKIFFGTSTYSLGNDFITYGVDIKKNVFTFQIDLPLSPSSRQIVENVFKIILKVRDKWVYQIIISSCSLHITLAIFAFYIIQDICYDGHKCNYVHCTFMRWTSPHSTGRICVWYLPHIYGLHRQTYIFLQCKYISIYVCPRLNLLLLGHYYLFPYVYWQTITPHSLFEYMTVEVYSYGTSWGTMYDFLYLGLMIPHCLKYLIDIGLPEK